ncbi:MAG TPA: hypothetical protein VJU16_07005 [Planctomycetota bacterium]|nr:hypothetical protein [Planctomycetota bacterium]
MTLVLVLALAIPTWGCGAGPDSWTNGDRATNNQSLQGVRKQIKAIDGLAPHAQGVVAIGLAAIRADLAIVELNLAKIEEIHKPPPEVKEFSDFNSKEARSKAAEEHQRTDWLGILQKVAIGLGTALTLAATVMNLPIVGPWLATTRPGQFVARAMAGKTVAVAQDAVKTISVIRSEAEKAPLTPQDVVRLAVSTFSPTTAKIADKVSDQIEAKAGIKVTAIADLPVGASTS